MAQTIGAVFELRDNFTAKAKQVASATKDLEGNIKGAANSVKSFGEGGNIASRGIDSLKGKIMGLATTYLSLQGAKKLAGSAIGEASGLEQYRNTLNTVMKDTKKAGETMAWAVDFANKTPFETNEVVDATVKLQSYGLSAKDVMTDIGNMSSVMNKPLDQAVEAVADAQTGELERLKEFGISKQMIIDQGNKIMHGKEIVNNKGQIVDQKNFNKALFSLMQERYKGGMDLQSKTLKGTWSNVTGIAKNSLAKLMGVAQDGTIKTGGLFDKLKGKVDTLAKTLEKWSNDGTIDKAAKKIEQGFDAAGKAIGWVKDNLNWLIPVTAGVVGALGALKIINTVNGLMKAWKKTTEAANGVMSILNITMKGSTFGIVIVLIGLAIAAGVALYQNWDTVKAKAKELWKSIKETFNKIKDDVIKVWKDIKEFLAHPIKGTINIAKNITGGGKAKDKADGKAANGLNRVPFDGYIGELHKDEMVLTKNQADNYRKGEGNTTKPISPMNVFVTIQGNVVGNEEFADEVGEHVGNKVLMALQNM